MFFSTLCTSPLPSIAPSGRGNRARCLNMLVYAALGCAVLAFHIPMVRAAESSEAIAFYERGIELLEGRSVAKDEHAAFEQFRRASALGHPDAQARLAECYYYGRGTAVDYDEAVELINDAYIAGSAHAAYLNGMLRKGDGGEDGAPFFQEAAEKGHARAKYELAMCFFNGWGVDQSDAHGTEWLRAAAMQGEPESIFNMGRLYRHGRGVSKNLDQAVEWFEKAVALNDVRAYVELGHVYYESDPVKAASWFRRAAEVGDDAGKFLLAHCYREGHGVEKNSLLAAATFKQLAEKGIAEADLELGELYLNGPAILHNPKLAVESLERASAKGLGDATFWLAYCYAMGIGVAQDQDHYDELMHKAAAQGSRIAKYTLEQKEKKAAMSQN